MEAANQRYDGRMNTFTINVPIGAQSAFLRTMSRNMGWEMTVSRSRKKADETLMTKKEFFEKIDRAKAQARNGGEGPVFSSSKDLFDYIESLAK